MTGLVRWILCLACLPFLACGFLGTDGMDGTPVADGLGPFGPDEAVTLCIDGARVAEISRPPGLCRAEGHESASCDRDSDCELPEACVCGKCTLKICEFSTECPEGTVCSGSPRRCLLRCESDDECGHLGLCESGTCLKACAEQEECSVGELCLAARCRAIACGPTGPNCGPGELCAQQLLGAETNGPSALRDGSRIVLFVGVVEDGSAGSVIYRFVSDDGLEFFADPPEPVLSPVGTGAFSYRAPSAIRTDGELRIFYEVDDGAAIESATDTSGSGASFGSGAVILTPIHAWEAGRVASPGATVIDGVILLAYEGGDGEGIGLSVSSGATFVNAATPSLTPPALEDPVRFSDVTEVRDPFPYLAVSESGRRVLRLYVGAMGIARPASAGGTFDQPNLSVAVAGTLIEDSLDGLVFDAHGANPVFGRVQNFRPLDETGPSLVEYGGRYLLYFEAADGIRVATNPIE